MPGETQGGCDPRRRLVREKYFCIRPRPLERWFWCKRVAASAERVFWLHWQEGMQRGDWCSEIPLSRVARECHLDVSTVTRAYQLLTRLGCLRRTDQGRDPANPFQQATALTEIRIPRELLVEIDRHPNRRGANDHEDGLRQNRAAGTPSLRADSSSSLKGAASDDARPSGVDGVNPNQPSGTGVGVGRTDGAGDDVSVRVTDERHPVGQSFGITDPFLGMSGRARSRALSGLIEFLSPTERHAYGEALRMHRDQMPFDVHSRVPGEARARLLRVLAWMAAASKSEVSTPRPHETTPLKTVRQRKLSTFELGHLSRNLQSTASTATAPELLRQVVWSIEAGALRRFDTRHALHIALKKIREGQWTRPHRMPPNWARALSNASAPEACGHA